MLRTLSTILLFLSFVALAPPLAAQDGARILTLDVGEVPRGWTARIAGAEAAAPPLDPSGYRRPDMLPEIVARRFDRVPARGLDNVRYWATSVADLSAACPALGLDAVSRDALPYVFASAADLFQRFQSGRLSDSEILQAGWMAILGLNAAGACRWDPSGPIGRDQAQAMCDDAAAARNDLGVLPSLDAQADIALFLSRHGCASPQAARLASGLREFGRQAPGRLFRSTGLPPADTPEGAAYRDILLNCNRGAFSEQDLGWCGCYVDTLYSLSPPRAVVDALALDPFADGSPMARITALPGGAAAYDCADTHYRTGDPRERYREKPTACLVDSAPRGDGQTDCTYRAAWGTFVLPGRECRPRITSRSWGSEEVDCAGGGAPAAAVEGARRWQDGAYTMIDWEAPVPDDFEPPMPEDTREVWPVQMRFLAREGAGQLTSQSVAEIREFDILKRFIMPGDPMEAPFRTAFGALRAEGALVLTCTWTTGQGTARRGHYWYGRVPAYVAGGYPPVLDPLFSPIGPGREACPARDPG